MKGKERKRGRSESTTAASEAFRIATQRLSSRGIRTNASIAPFVNGSVFPQLRSSKDIARRVCICIAIQSVASAAIEDLKSAPEASKIVINWLKEERLWDAVEEDEQYFLEFPLEQSPTQGPEEEQEDQNSGVKLLIRDSEDDEEEEEGEEEEEEEEEGEGPSEYELASQEMQMRTESAVCLSWLLGIPIITDDSDHRDDHDGRSESKDGQQTSLPFPVQPLPLLPLLNSGSLPFPGSSTKEFVSQAFASQRSIDDALVELETAAALAHIMQSFPDEESVQDYVLEAVQERQRCLAWACGLRDIMSIEDEDD
eukprot:ANDGO_06056.mRNA.1 hypothetical protein